MYRDIVDYEEAGEFTIHNVTSRSMLDSRGNPTVQAEVYTEGGGIGVAMVPSGASTGTHEALEIRDGDPKRFRGKGVDRAVKNVQDIIAPQIVGMDCRRQREIDETMIRLDGTPNKSRLGANAILAVSLACTKAAADTLGVPLFVYLGGLRARTLPTPMLNVINGGRHAGNELAIQEFMIVPGGFDSFSDALRAASEIYHALKEILKARYGGASINVGDEGGYAPPMRETREALDALKAAVEEAGYTLGGDVALALDAAASSFYKDGVYLVDGERMERDELIDFYLELVDEYSIISLEDPLHEDDFEGFAELNRLLGGKALVVGDDLLVTRVDRLSRAVKAGAVSGAIVKMNQVGTVTETMDFVEMARQAGVSTIISHRSGDTEDPAIADLAVGLDAGTIKTGAPARGERTAKYNRLLRIEEMLGGEAGYAGFRPFKK